MFKLLSDENLKECVGGSYRDFGQTFSGLMKTVGGIKNDPFLSTFPPPTLNGNSLGYDLGVIERPNYFSPSP